jgi:hypothetical protein
MTALSVAEGAVMDKVAARLSLQQAGGRNEYWAICLWARFSLPER